MQIGNWKLTTDAIQLFFLVAMFSFGVSDWLKPSGRSESK
jgi:hypothetical protein